jgi:hypothetical protein
MGVNMLLRDYLPVGELADAAKANLLSRERCDSENEDEDELLTVKDIDLIDERPGLKTLFNNTDRQINVLVGQSLRLMTCTGKH